LDARPRSALRGEANAACLPRLVNATVPHVPKLFLPQTLLETWVSQEKADLRGEALFVTAEKSTVPLTPAVHFTKVVSGGDTRKLVNKVKTKEQLTELRAEHMMDSVILGDDAYEVVPGYVADVTVPVPPGKKGSTEAELLAEFFLNKLS
jgi:hypothetical protein